MIVKSYEILKNPENFIRFNLFLLYGENYGLKKDIKKSIEMILNKQDSNIEFLLLFEDEILQNEENFYNFIYSGSLFSKRKIITINNGTEKITKQIHDILDKYPENIFIIIFSNILEKKSKLRILFETNSNTICIPCYLDTNRDLESIIQLEIKKNNIILSRESINLIIEKSNNDRHNLKNEIEKIKNFALDKKKLDVGEVKSIINFSGEHKSDSLINECLCGNILQYKKIISELYVNTVNQLYFLRTLGNKIHKLVKMKEIESNYTNLDNLINSSKPPIFWKEKPIIKKQLTIWSLRELKNTINEINNTELLCKKNPQISKLIFFNFFTKICNKANNYS